MTRSDSTVRYASVNAAVDEMRTMHPFLRMVLEKMRHLGDDRRNPKLYRKTEQALAMLEDRNQLRRSLEKLREADGTVVFRFSPEAAAFFEETS